MSDLSSSSLFFFFNDTATTEIYTLSLHDALPILSDPRGPGLSAHEGPVADAASRGGGRADRGGGGAERAAEHHPPGARTGRQGEGGLDASRDPARRRGRPLLRRSLRPGEEGGDRRDRERRAGPAGRLRQAHRARQRARWPRQHHRHHRAVRRGGVATRGAGRRSGTPAVPAHRHGNEHGARPRVPREPTPRAEPTSALAHGRGGGRRGGSRRRSRLPRLPESVNARFKFLSGARAGAVRSEEHTSELQSRLHLVCRLLLEKKKNYRYRYITHTHSNKH